MYVWQRFTLLVEARQEVEVTIPVHLRYHSPNEDTEVAVALAAPRLFLQCSGLSLSLLFRVARLSFVICFSENGAAFNGLSGKDALALCDAQKNENRTECWWREVDYAKVRVADAVLIEESLLMCSQWF